MYYVALRCTLSMASMSLRSVGPNKNQVELLDWYIEMLRMSGWFSTDLVVMTHPCHVAAENNSKVTFMMSPFNWHVVQEVSSTSCCFEEHFSGFRDMSIHDRSWSLYPFAQSVFVVVILHTDLVNFVSSAKRLTAELWMLFCHSRKLERVMAPICSPVGHLIALAVWRMTSL